MTSIAQVPTPSKTREIDLDQYELLSERMLQVESLIVTLNSATDDERNTAPPTNRHIRNAFWALHVLMEQAHEAREKLWH